MTTIKRNASVARCDDRRRQKELGLGKRRGAGRPLPHVQGRGLFSLRSALVCENDGPSQTEPLERLKES